MRTLLFALLLASACQEPRPEPSLTSTHAPLVASPQLTFGPVVITPAPGVQRNATSAYAWLSTKYLVVWEDLRSPLSAYPAIYAARVEVGTGVIDTLGLVLSTRPVPKANPVVTSDGNDFLVAWEESNGSTTDIIGTRVTAAGQVLDPGGLPLLVQAGVNQRSPALANQVSTYFVMARSVGLGTTQLSAAQVRRDGTTITAPLAFTMAPEAPSGQPALFQENLQMTVLYANGAQVESFRIMNFARIDPVAVVLDVSAGEKAGMSVISLPNGDFLAAWSSGSSPFTDVYFAPIYFDGGVTPAGRLPLSVGAPDDRLPSLSIEDGTANVLAAWWRNGSDAVGTRVGLTSGFPLLDAPGVPLAATANGEARPRLSGAGVGGTLLTYDLDTGFVNDVFGRAVRYDDAGVSGPFRISSSAAPQRAVALTFGTRFSAAWIEDAPTGAIAVRGGSLQLDAGNFSIASPAIDPGSNDVTEVAEASDGTNTLVAWVENDDVFARLVAGDGTPLGAILSLGATNRPENSVAVGFDGAAFIVAWRDVNPNDTLVLAAVATDGATASTPVLVAAAVAPIRHPSLCQTKDGALVMWLEDARVKARTVRSAGAAMPGFGTSVTLADAGREVEPKCAFAPGSASGLAVWSDPFQLLSTPLVLTGATLSLGATQLVYPAGVDRRSALVGWLGGAYVVGTLLSPGGQPATPVVGLVSGQGLPLSPELPVGLAQENPGRLVMATNGVDEALLATTSWTSVPTLRAPRAAAWHVTWRPGGGQCLSPSECQSGACMGGFCEAVDAGVEIDGGADAGVADGGAVDGGAVDAGSVDAGAVDGGSFDAGTTLADGGVNPDVDAGVNPGPQHLSVGCACSAAPVSLELIAFGLFGLRRSRRK